MGWTDMGGERRDSGRLYEGMAGSEEEIVGTMPSGVDWREPFKPLRYERVGLPRDEGMAMEAVLRAKLFEGEGILGRE